MRNKSEVVDLFVRFTDLLENETGRKLLPNQPEPAVMQKFSDKSTAQSKMQTQVTDGLVIKPVQVAHTLKQFKYLVLNRWHNWI